MSWGFRACLLTTRRKHIRAHHPPVQRNAGPFLCPRCCQGFVSKNELDSHLRQLDVCRVSFDSGGADPEDGITQKIISSLEARSLKAKIDNWLSLWKLLFPADQVIPDPGKHAPAPSPFLRSAMSNTLSSVCSGDGDL